MRRRRAFAHAGCLDALDPVPDECGQLLSVAGGDRAVRVSRRSVTSGQAPGRSWDYAYSWGEMPSRAVTKMWDSAAADLVVVVHLLFIGFVVCGAFLTWRWPRVVWAHIPALVYGALVEFAGIACPLTLLENDLRRRAGQAGYRGGFIAHYLVKVIYPPGLTRGMRVGLGIVVLLVAAIGYRGFLRRHARRPRRELTSDWKHPVS